jgi:general secretion pathway protein D
VSQVVEQEEIGLPTTLKRTAETTVIIKDRHTVVIGGLIDELLTRGTSGVPCLGNIPLLGSLFKTQARSNSKSNLFIFLTPHIIENPEEATAVYEEKKEYIEEVEERVIKMYERPKREGEETEAEGTDVEESPVEDTDVKDTDIEGTDVKESEVEG